MRITFRIDCSANEFRRLGGQPDLLPLVELAGVAMERWLQARVLAAGRIEKSAASPGPVDAGGETGGQGMQAHGRRRSDRL
jgi:hypothetical protein